MTDTGFCQEKNNCPDKTRNRKDMVTEAVQVLVAWFVMYSSCKGSEEKGEREGGRTAS